MIKVIEPSRIKTINIEFNYAEDQNEKDVSAFIEALNIMPLVYISKRIDNEVVSGMTIEPINIKTVRIYNNKFLPEIYMSFDDDLGYMFEDFFPLDDDIISIFVNSDSEDIFPIRMDFKITEFNVDKVIPGENSKLSYIINGILDVNDLHFSEFKAYKGTSYNVLKQICNETGLGFASNAEGSDDEMTWINPANPLIKFIDEVTRKSYIDEKSFIWTFIDFYYNLNYVNIEQEMALNPQEKQTSNLSILNLEEDEVEIVDMYFTNNEALNTTNQYIDRFSIMNRSSKTNLKIGYNYSLRYYNKTNNTQIRVKVPEFHNNDENLYKLDGYDYDKNNFLSNFNWNGCFFGKLDEDNLHPNYILAEKINSLNLDKAQKTTMIATLSQLNFNIKRFQKVNIIIRNVDNIIKDHGNEPQDNINQKLSGYWLVTGINYTFNRNGGVSQQIFLSRRDLNIKYTEIVGMNKLIEDNKK